MQNSAELVTSRRGVTKNDFDRNVASAGVSATFRQITRFVFKVAANTDLRSLLVSPWSAFFLTLDNVNKRMTTGVQRNWVGVGVVELPFVVKEGHRDLFPVSSSNSLSPSGDVSDDRNGGGGSILKEDTTRPSRIFVVGGMDSNTASNSDIDRIARYTVDSVYPGQSLFSHFNSRAFYYVV
jgi:hypothetical protein